MHIAGMAVGGVAHMAVDTMVVGTIITVDGSEYLQ
jgi:hypothetical protein